MRHTPAAEGEEVGPIVFRREPSSPLPPEPVDHIALPPSPAELGPAELGPAGPAGAEPEPLAAPPRKRGGLAGGLVLGLVAGAAAGAVAGLIVLHRLDLPGASKAAQRSPSQVLAQALTTGSRPAVIAAAPAPIPAPLPLRPEAGAKATGGIDLDQLAKTIAAATPPPAANAVSTQPAAPPIIEPAPALAAGPPRPPPAAAPPITAPPIIVAKPSAPPPVLKAAPPPPPAPSPRNDPDLAEAEQRLNLAYDRAMASAPDRAALHDEQQRWLAQAARRGDKAAMLSAYQARIDALTEQDRIERKKGGIARLLRD